MADIEAHTERSKRSAGPAMPLPDQTVLLLQGGGALGSFQAGVFQGLSELSIPLTCVAGISIGAVNAALIAGNPPEKRLEALTTFWNMVSGGMPNFVLPEDNRVREGAHIAAAATVASFGVPGFFRPHWVPPGWSPAGSEASISYYDSAPLAETLDKLVDWDLLNDGPMRVAVGAVDIETGNFQYFDTRSDDDPVRIDARHIMASGALPPGLPPVEIDGRHYWDGGLVSNTPLGYILDTQGNEDTLIFQVDLFPARGQLPRRMTDVWAREKDIRFSSRTRAVTDQYLRLRQDHEAMRKLLDRLPEDMQDEPEVKALRERVAESAVNVVQLVYRTRAWETGAKDFEFSRSTMLDHWHQGHDALCRSIDKGDILAHNIADGKTDAFDLVD
ncbi:patatin-like phospholipase family protein [Novosphingopyxis iocasae]|uniref:patatin-like phospholipase family protein n=1 Tax=Novosphingopyxis iocasae TaxID=2762729 RepID=UPI001650DFD1|nr:DUF3734 domain-containing protein [Novosphingopyxis iocasae]